MKKLLFVFLLLSACTETSETVLKTYLMDAESAGTQQLLSDLIHIESVTPLDPSLIMSEVKDLVYRPLGDIYLRSTNPEKLVRLDSTGSLVSQYGSIGDGPGEYSEIKDFGIDQDNNVHIFDRGLSRVTQYDADGSYIKSITLDMFAQAIDVHNGYYILYNGNERSAETNHKVVVLHDGEILSQHLPIKTEYSQFLNFFDLSNFTHNDLSRFYYSFCDTVYHIKDDAIEPAYYIDLGKDKLLPEDLDKGYANSYEFMMAVRRNEKAFRIMGLEENDQWISFLFEKDGFKFATINKEDQSTAYHSTIIDDVFGDNEIIEEEVLFEYLPLYAEGDLHYYYISGDMLTSDKFRETYGLSEGQSCIVGYTYRD